MLKTLKKLFRLGGAVAEAGTFVGRARTCDVAFPFRMGAGFLGDVTRVGAPSPTIEPSLQDATNPPNFYGCPVVINAAGTGVRQLLAADTALTAIYGIVVRPFPINQAAATNFGAAAIGGFVVPVIGAVDVLKSGYCLGYLSGTGTPVKGGAVFVWVAASAGSHVQGGFETTATGGSTIPLSTANPNIYFNGPGDSSGNVEIAYNI